MRKIVAGILTRVSGNVNANEVDGDRIRIKKMISTTGEVYPFVSARAIKRGIREKFAEYGFNKSHSAAYAMIAYQTAFLKYYYPAWPVFYHTRQVPAMDVDRPLLPDYLTVLKNNVFSNRRIVNIVLEILS